jgi:hypothetical protein
MGWTIYYRIECDRAWSEEDKRQLRRHSETWNEKLSPLSEPYSVTGIVTTRSFKGATRPAPSAHAASDYVVIVQALRELEKLFPEARCFVSDDSGYYDAARPSDVDLGSLRARMLEEWGTDEAAPDDPEPEDAEARELRALPSQVTPEDMEQVRPLLEKARRDFEIWKQAQKKEKP